MPELTKYGWRKKAIKAIQEHELVFFNELPPYMGCERRTLYNHELHLDQKVMGAIEANRIAKKQELRKKWMRGGTATTEIALYKLLATEEEWLRLTANTNVSWRKKEDATPVDIEWKIETIDPNSDHQAIPEAGDSLAPD